MFLVPRFVFGPDPDFPEEEAMSPLRFFSTGQGAGNRQSHKPPISGGAATAAAPARAKAAAGAQRSAAFPVQAKDLPAAARAALPHFPFQTLPKPNGPAPYRFDLSQLLSAD